MFYEWHQFHWRIVSVSIFGAASIGYYFDVVSVTFTVYIVSVSILNIPSVALFLTVYQSFSYSTAMPNECFIAFLHVTYL